MREVYLDHSATTYVDPRVKEAMEPYFSEEFGNPGSFNSKGLRAKKALADARESIAKILNCDPKDIVFTGSGTESDNLAIQGVARAVKGGHIITQKTEHHAVLDTCKHLESNGFEVTYLKPDEQGLISPEQLEKEIRDDTFLITIMYANNEIGTVQPIEELAKIAKKHDVLFHTDACQAGSYLDLNVEELGVDLMTLNGSKIYGPKGIGMLYVKSGVPIKPLVFGGGQESGLRSGTENLPGIVGFSKALELAQSEREEESKRLSELRDQMIVEILKIPKTKLNGHPTQRLPNNVNVSFLDVEGEAMLLKLNEEGIQAATGSACTSKSLDPSHVLLALSIPHEVAHGSLRFTMGKRTTKEDIDYVLEHLPKTIESLRAMSPLKIKNG